MLKKRLIFTLIHNDKSYMLSRNFRMQRVGDIKWLKQNYNFSKVAMALDELIILDATPGKKDIEEFSNQIKAIINSCFIPIAAGGGIRSLADAELLLNSGADKLVINTILHTDPVLVKELVKLYGSQCIIASIDYKIIDNVPAVFIRDGTEKLNLPFEEYMQLVVNLGIGELYLNSIDKDGTGQGYALEIFAYIAETINIPIIMAGGAGNHHHLIEGILMPRVDAVATANLFNFIGDGILLARQCMYDAGVPMSHWNSNEIAALKNYFGNSDV